MDPAKAASDGNVILANLMYMGLVRLDAAYHVLPAAAARWTVSPDHTTYTFYLRRNLRFSNGDPITAADFAYSIERSLNPAVQSTAAPSYLLDIKGAPFMLAGQASHVAGVNVVGRYVLRIVARWPVTYFLMELTYPTSFAVDRKAIERDGGVDNTAWYAHPVSSGPYRLKSWSPDTKMVLVPNKYYSLSHPAVGTITVSLGPLPVSSVYSFVQRNLDIVALPASATLPAKGTGMTDAEMLAGAGIYMRFASKPFKSARFRSALTMCLPRSRLVQVALGRAATPLDGMAPPNQYASIAFPQDLRYNVPRARWLARASGYTGKKRAHLTLAYVGGDAGVERLVKAVVKAWHQCLGITMATQALTANTLLAKAQANQLALYLSTWSADYPDPHDWIALQWESQALNNVVGYHNTEFDRVVQTADVTWDARRRSQLYQQAQHILIDDSAWIPLYIPHRTVYIRPTINNLVLTGFGLLPRMGDWSAVSIRSAPRVKRTAR